MLSWPGCLALLSLLTWQTFPGWLAKLCWPGMPSMLTKQADKFDGLVADEEMQAPTNAANLTEVFLYGQVPTTPKPQSVRNKFVIENKYAHPHYMPSNHNYSLAHSAEPR